MSLFGPILKSIYQSRPILLTLLPSTKEDGKNSEDIIVIGFVHFGVC